MLKNARNEIIEDLDWKAQKAKEMLHLYISWWDMST
jgi:hypothetical protein